MLNNPLSLIADTKPSLFSDRFQRMDRLFSHLTGAAPLQNFPAYDIRQQDDNHYAISVSVPGFSEAELDVSVRAGEIIITGKREQKKQDNQPDNWLHRGILYEDFTLSLALRNSLQVENAQLQHGVLTINLRQEVPESEKFKRININTRGEGRENSGAVLEHPKKSTEEQEEK